MENFRDTVLCFDGKCSIITGLDVEEHMILIVVRNLALIL